jgi:hypothetical protein
MLPALLLSLAPVLVIVAFRALCTLGPPPVPTYLERPRAPTMEEWWLSEKRG